MREKIRYEEGWGNWVWRDHEDYKILRYEITNYRKSQ